MFIYFLHERVEEYFEEEHQVLNKPLHSNVIDIKFPKLPKDYSYWLSRPAQQEEKPDSGYGPYRKVIGYLRHVNSSPIINQNFYT